MPFSVIKTELPDHELSLDATTTSGRCVLLCSCGEDMSFDTNYTFDDVKRVLEKTNEHLAPIMAGRLSQEEWDSYLQREEHVMTNLLPALARQVENPLDSDGS